MVKIQYATISETGKRKNNEDAFRMIGMSDNNMSKEKNNLNVNVFGHEFEVHVPKGKQRSEHRSFLRKIKYILK